MASVRRPDKKYLLLEIGTEEIPAGFISLALTQLKELVDKVLKDNRITPKEIQVWGTPRRLTLYVAEVNEYQTSHSKSGPSKAAPYEQRKGFAKKHGKSVEDLITDDKTERVYIVIPGEPVIKVLPNILPQIIQAISFPKTMRWGEGDFCFARPIHWIMALFRGKVIKFEIAKIISSNKSYGHRFLAPQSFTVADFNSYKDELRKRFVIIDQTERKQLIEQQIQQVVSKVGSGCQVLKDDELLNEVTYLVEYPVAVLGYFDKEYLQLPREVLICAMREHQRYFAIQDAEGNLCPAFITISNMPDEKDYIAKGNERVIRARLADARFFFEEDLKKPLAERLDDLKGMTYQRDLGTYYDKTQRIEALAEYIAQKLNLNHKIDMVKRAAMLCKCDLLTEMVGEFPKLQGIMGKEYAWHSDEDEQIAQAIYEHYLPRFVGDELPNTNIGAIVSLADKLDTIVGCFFAKLLPSGSQDPYGLRRQAVGVINILLNKEWHLPLGDTVDVTLKLVEEIYTPPPKTEDVMEARLYRPKDIVKKEVLDYFWSRIFLVLGNSRLADAVLISGFDDVVDAKQRLEALKDLSQQPDFDSLMIAARRVARIIPPDYKSSQVKPDLFQEEAEKILYGQFKQIKTQVVQSLNQRDYTAALKTLASLRPDVDRFFDDVMVMTDDEALRNNRLALLSEIELLFSRIADFSKIVVQ